MGSSKMFMLAMVMAVVVLSMTSCFGQSKETTPGCAQDLVPCADYLNNTNPPSTTCCTAIKQTVATQLACLCNLFFTPGLLELYGGNTTSGLRIATACGETMDVNKCKAAIGAPTPQSPPATPGAPKADDGGSSKIAWAGFSALLIFWASVMFC
ncbi:PREDICTED: lipid [Prunus dulcis]|uniref:PREDICTED: lipid n=1 Tax=Prunus dulcis TaxID=3755 RepID=A0A5E4FXA0_PRUDU|nr:uncharacterized protein LOC117629300 [Prunus dulcis]VVA31990.1 PREDICTED: lipid [Prunus dulcis]